MRRFFGNWYVVTLLCAALAALLLAVGLPYVVLWLRPVSVRVGCVVLVAAVWGGLFWYRRHRAASAAAAIAAELAGPNAADEEGRALAQRMGDALGRLKTASGGRRDYLYSRPWYVIIGPPGAGKTTALLRSGLRFPFVEQAVKGVGGTRNLDFWFADEAVLVDTAGRYTTQDSDAGVDAAGWTSFLSLLRRHRPRQPINGVLVAIGVDELIRSDCAAIDAHARAVRRRLTELRRTLEVAAPVYLVLTKADLLAGFIEYFDDLDVEGRRAVLGSTLPFGDGRATAEGLAHAFDEVAQAVADRQAKRVFDEVDPRRRALLLGFPAQLRSLRARLMRFADGAFVAGDEALGGAGGVLRGFYLTSGVQEGAPLDRILAGMAEVYDRPAVPTTAAGSSGGRAYFLNRLLTEVLFPEAGLVSDDPRARVRQRGRLVATLAGITAAAVLVIALWGVSYARNRAFQAHLAAGAAGAEQKLRDAGVDLAQVRDGDADLRAALPGLDALRDLPRGYAERQRGGPPIAMTLGLYQRGLSQEAEETYREGLRRVMLPRLLLRLEAVLKSAGSDPAALYEPLKIYLMLGQQGPMDARAIRAWVTDDWATQVFPGADSQADRTDLAGHLDALLADGDMASVWPDRRPPLDGALVARARAAVQTLSLADRAYAVMKQRAASARAAWEAANILSAGDALAFANPQQVLARRIPYFFTRDGYDRAYLPGLATVQQDLKRDLWVLGGVGEAGVAQEVGNVRPGVAGLYAKDYVAAWQGLLDLLKPGAYFHDPAAFGAFTKSPSPLKRILLELRKNTIFTGGAQAGLAHLARYGMNRSRYGRVADDLSRDRARGIDAGDEITAAFAGVHEYVGDGRGTAPVDDFVTALKSAGQAVMAAQSVGGGGGSDSTQAAMATSMASVKAAAAGAPPELQAFVSSAAKGGAAAQTTAATGAVAAGYAQAVLPACREATGDRFPFVAASATDAPVADVLHVFGMGGVVDSFVQTRLRPLLATDGPDWRWRRDDPVAASLAPSSAAMFTRAGAIRDLLAGGLPIKVAVASFGSGVATVEVTSGGTRYRFTAASNAARPLFWSANGGLPEASVVLYGPAAKATSVAVPVGDDAPPGPELARIGAEGPWALFRLMGKARVQNAGPTALKGSFGTGSAATVLSVMLPGAANPFGRSGPWSFRCPETL
ncbi:MAG: type VI secretion system membrane subunit TssM [Janthinobacterium lividum]